MAKKATGEVKRLLVVIGELQTMIGLAEGYHEADRDQEAFVKAQRLLRQAFDLCVKTTSGYDPV